MLWAETRSFGVIGHIVAQSGAMILAAVCILTPTYAQEAGSATFERFLTEQGLSNYSVTSILQDRSGFMWFGTQGGLNRYDGYRFRQFTSENSPLADDFINSLFQDRRGIIWIGTRNAGVYAFDPSTHSFTGYASDPDDPSSLSHNDVRAIFEDSQGTLWIGTYGGGINRFDRTSEEFTRVALENVRRDGSETIWAIQEAPRNSGILWVGTDAGLVKLSSATQDRGDFIRPESDTTRIGDPVRSLYVDRSGELWIGTQNRGLYALDPVSGARSQFVYTAGDPTSLPSDHVLAINEDPSDALWIGTYDGGLARFDRSSQQFLRYQNVAGDRGSLPHNEVHAVLVDRNAVLWVGTWGGLGKHVPPREGISHFTHRPNDPNSLSHPSVASIFEDRSGMLWIGTHGGGLNRLNPQNGGITRYSLPFDDVIALCEDRSGGMWLGTRDNNLYHFDRETGRVTAYQLDDDGASHSDDIVLSIYEAPSRPGVLWIGTKLNGLYAFDVHARTTIHHYVSDPSDPTSLSDNYAWPIYEDRSGVLWVGTVGGGLNRFDPENGSFQSYRLDDDDPHSISGDRVISIQEDQLRRLWVGTFRRGLNRFDRATERFTNYTVEDGLPDNDIAGILPDDGESLWISTNNGISKFNPQTETFSNYGVAFGLQSTIFRIGAAYKTRDGKLVFGGENGINIIRPTRTEGVGPEPPVILTDFHVLDQSARLDSAVSAISVVTLDHDENFVAFEFAVLDFTDPSKNQYAYQLEGVDNDWVSAGSLRSARYPKLEPGDYTFRVKGANSNNVWNEQGASIRLIIRPPWWQTAWAYALYVIAIASLVYGSYRWRVRRLKELAIELREKVDERTKDLRAEKRKTEEQAAKLVELEEVKDRFFANISHEFRTPLTVMLGPVQDALSGAYGTVPPKLRAQLEMMRRNGDRLHRLINELLDLSKLEIGRMQLHARRQDLVSFVEEIVLSFSSLADRRKITLHCDSDVARLPLYFEADKLEKVITNLLSNALKFTPEQGKVWVNIRDARNGTDGVSSPLAEIRVKDTGPGIPTEELPHIFDRFHQVDTSMTREHAGTGIGLALTKELVERHGGMIRVESEEGFGSTFTIHLPTGKDHLDPEDLVDEKTPEESLRGHDGARPFTYGLPDLTAEVVSEPDFAFEVDTPRASAPTILIVEDSEDVRIYLKSHLASLYHVIEAADGQEGLELAREHAPDLVISDVMMPKMDGIELCSALKEDEALNHIPVILLTAKATESSEIEGLATGADDYIYKPFNAEVLLARVENLLEVRRMLRRRFSDELRIGPSEISVPSEEAAFLKQVRTVVETHLSDSNFSVDWFADEVGMSRRHLQRRLKEAANLSPGGYIRMMRLERAAQLLEQDAGSVSEIAYQVGFKNADHFSRVFQQVFDVPPSRYPTK